jgi:hypothetical protein
MKPVTIAAPLACFKSAEKSKEIRGDHSEPVPSPQFLGMKRNQTLVALPFAVSILFAGAQLCSAQYPQFGANQSPADAKWNQTALDSASAQLERTMLHRGNLWYAGFSVKNVTPPTPPSFGFVEPLRPRTAEAGAKEGLIEISFFRPSAYSLPSRPPSEWRGEVSARIHQYRIFRPGAGWSQPNLVMLHYWEWSAEARDGRLSLQSKTDAASGTTDGGPTEFIAALFNIPANQVTCFKPNSEIPDPTPTSPQRQQRGPNGRLLPGTVGSQNPY